MRQIKQKDRKSRKTELLRSAGISPGVLDSVPVINITGTEYASIEHHCGVLQLSDRCIRLYSPLGIIRITGQNLSVISMDNEMISIFGQIWCAAYEKFTSNEDFLP